MFKNTICTFQLSNEPMKTIIYQFLSRVVQKSPRAGEKLGMVVGFALR